MQWYKGTIAYKWESARKKELISHFENRETGNMNELLNRKWSILHSEKLSLTGVILISSKAKDIYSSLMNHALHL